MNLNEIEAKCFIMALFIRDDGLRFLLGSGAYEFKDSQLMFAGNTIENDVVSVQGNDGYMLAGQVRRPNTQVFDGYIGDASVSKSEVEGYRRDFMAFFQKNHFYTVVYVMADGSAIQRRRGFLVDAPTSQELWQMYPEYHVALNFEDVNYYKYSENDDGEETYAKSADIGLAKVQYGGLIWDNNSEIEISGTGTNITLKGTMEGGAIESVEMYGDTEQTTYSGKNLYESIPRENQGLVGTLQADGTVAITGKATSNYSDICSNATTNLAAGTYTFSMTKTMPFRVLLRVNDSQNLAVLEPGAVKGTFTVAYEITQLRVFFFNVTSGTTYNETVGFQLETGSTQTSFEPYVGGTASPNPDYPQEVQTVTGEQTITISDGQGNEQEYPVNFGNDNLIDQSTMEQGTFNYLNGELSDDANRIRTQQIPCTPGTTYTVSANRSLSEAAVVYYGSDGTTVIAGTGASSGNSYYTFTSPNDAYYMRIRLGSQWNAMVIGNDYNIMLVVGSEPAQYEAYTGYKYELCKIGTYQDYIYKSGEDWYLHKETGKMVLDGTETVTKPFTNIFVVENLSDDWLKRSETVFYYCADYYGLKAVESNSQFNTLAAQYNYVFDFTSGQNGKNIRFKDTRYDNIDNYKTWLASNNVTIYYALATPTDTQITNATLIAQLNALNDGETYDGTTIITVASENLAGPLEVKVITIGGGGVVWDENGAEWEAGGGGEIVIVNVDSIENILPVWTIRGEAENPTLTNLTTGMSITYNGTVASGQTLVIDLLNKTAKLNGTSVISDVSGQWVEFKPGNNRVSYSTENANAPDSTIEWQEVVG